MMCENRRNVPPTESKIHRARRLHDLADNLRVRMESRTTRIHQRAQGTEDLRAIRDFLTEVGRDYQNFDQRWAAVCGALNLPIGSTAREVTDQIRTVGTPVPEDSAPTRDAALVYKYLQHETRAWLLSGEVNRALANVLAFVMAFDHTATREFDVGDRIDGGDDLNYVPSGSTLIASDGNTRGIVVRLSDAHPHAVWSTWIERPWPATLWDKP